MAEEVSFEPEELRVLRYSLHATIHALDINNLPEIEWEEGATGPYAQLHDSMIARQVLIKLFGTDEEDTFGLAD